MEFIFIYLYRIELKWCEPHPAWEKSRVFNSSPAFWAANWTPSSNVEQLQPALGNDVTEESRDIAGRILYEINQVAPQNGYTNQNQPQDICPDCSCSSKLMMVSEVIEVITSAHDAHACGFHFPFKIIPAGIVRRCSPWVMPQASLQIWACTRPQSQKITKISEILKWYMWFWWIFEVVYRDFVNILGTWKKTKKSGKNYVIFM